MAVRRGAKFCITMCTVVVFIVYHIRHGGPRTQEETTQPPTPIKATMANPTPNKRAKEGGNKNAKGEKQEGPIASSVAHVAYRGGS